MVTLSVGKKAFNANTSVHMADKKGYVFCGWTNAVGTVVADPFPSATHDITGEVELIGNKIKDGFKAIGQ